MALNLEKDKDLQEFNRKLREIEDQIKVNKAYKHPDSESKIRDQLQVIRQQLKDFRDAYEKSHRDKAAEARWLRQMSYLSGQMGNMLTANVDVKKGNTLSIIDSFEKDMKRRFEARGGMPVPTMTAPPPPSDDTTPPRPPSGYQATSPIAQGRKDRPLPMTPPEKREAMVKELGEKLYSFAKDLNVRYEEAHVQKRVPFAKKHQAKERAQQLATLKKELERAAIALQTEKDPQEVFKDLEAKINEVSKGVKGGILGESRLAKVIDDLRSDIKSMKSDLGKVDTRMEEMRERAKGSRKP